MRSPAAQRSTREEEPRLYNLLENLCISRGIPMPKLKIMDGDALNAFATGLNQKQYSITVTTGLMSGLNDAEMEAVLAPRTDAHPQRRRAHDGDRRDHRGRDLVLRRILLPHDVHIRRGYGGGALLSSAAAAAEGWRRRGMRS